MKLDKFLLIGTFVLWTLYFLYSWFYTPWSLELNATQIKRSNTLAIGLSFAAFGFTIALAFINSIKKRYPKILFWPILVLMIFGLIWSLYVVLIDKQYSSFLVRDNFPPTFMILCTIIFVGYNDEFWPIIKKIIFWLSIIFIFLSIIEALRAYLMFGFSYRITSSAPMYFFQAGFYSLYGVILLSDEWKKNKKILILILLLCAFFNSAIIQSRSWFLQVIILFIIYLFKIRSFFKNNKTAFVGVFTVMVGVVCFLLITNASLFDGLINRFDNSGDTRTNQIVTFFEQIPISKLLIGSGTRASYSFMGIEAYNYIDNQVLLFLFRYGIIPTICYCFLVVYPIVRSFALHDRKLIVKSIVLMSWFSAMIGLSVYFSLAIGYITLISFIYIGRLFYEVNNCYIVKMEGKF